MTTLGSLHLRGDRWQALLASRRPMYSALFHVGRNLRGDRAGCGDNDSIAIGLAACGTQCHQGGSLRRIKNVGFRLNISPQSETITLVCDQSSISFANIR
jgi:hypothetical protein